MKCKESMSKHPEFTCGSYAVWVVVYTGTDDETHTRYACSQHLAKAVTGVDQVKKPVTWVHVVSKKELLSRDS